MVERKKAVCGAKIAKELTVTSSTVFFVEALEARCLLSATTLRIDVGGNGFVEDTGKTWQADRGFTGGTVAMTGTDVAGTSSDDFFNTRRYGNFSYSLAIRNGDYRVRLLLMDPTDVASQRQFDVFSEKKLVLKDFDIAAAGGMNTAVTKTFTTEVIDGRLNLWFQNVQRQGDRLGDRSHADRRRRESRGSRSPMRRRRSLNRWAMSWMASCMSLADIKTRSIDATAQVAVYDPAAGTWSTRHNMPEALTHSGTANDGQFIYLAGGYVGDWHGAVTPVTRDVWRYDTVNDKWTHMLSLPEARAAGALVRVGRKLHFFGGLDSNKDDSGDHWVLDLRHPTKWITGSSRCPTRETISAGSKRAGKCMRSADNMTSNEDTGNDAEVDAYDVVTATWAKVASLPEVLSHVHNATFVSGGNVMTVGGSTAGETSVSDVLQYDPSKNMWRKVGDLPVPLSAAVADLLNGHIVVTGGTSGGGVPVKTTYINV